ncbi:MAG: c-type cytochrome [Gammaproteobacteria bacterium]|nr:c-type cytochrome [Gammaproteobacteria bacterium]
MNKLILVIIGASVLVTACDNPEKPVNKAASKVEPVSSVAPPVTVEAPAVNTAVVDTKTVSTPLASPVATAESIYNRSCAACHKTGAANAPKVGDAAAWTARIAKGKDALLQSALKGVPGTAMMPKGACSACSDDEIKSVLDFMLSQSQ